MRKLHSSAIITLLIAASIQAVGQDAKLDTLKKDFRTFRETVLQEKLFVHTDQDFYMTGETLWFRIYAVDGTFHKPVNVSKVAYVELLGSNSSAIVQSKVQLSSNGGRGSLFIPATLGSGTYELRVYTRWMRNFPSSYFFRKKITIVNPFLRPEPASDKPTPAAIVEFFPEGGNWVAGHRTKVGFRIRSASSDAVTSAVVLENDRDTVAVLSALKFGLGNFVMTPKAGVQYRCRVKLRAGGSQTVDLPNVQENGISMTVVDSSASSLKVIARRSESSANALAHTYLFIHSRHVLVHAEAKAFYPNSATFLIDKSLIPGGVTHLTLFDENLNPVCERLYFKRPEKELRVDISTNQSTYSTRRNVELDLKTAYKGSSISSNASVAVYKIDSLSADEQRDIYTHLYLTSDLAGQVDSASYYFQSTPDVAIAADNLMLTHGWRRFKWDDVRKRTTSLPFIPEFRSHLVTGKVAKSDQTPAQGILTYLSSPGKIVNLYGARSNKDGEVQFEVRDFWGSRQLIMQTNFAYDSAYSLSVNNSYDPAPPMLSLPPFKLTLAMEGKLNSKSVAMQVQDIYYRQENEKVLSVKNDSTAFFGPPDEIYNLDDYTRFPVMEEVMREYVPGVMVRKRKDGFHFIVLDMVNKGVLPDNPLVVIDGVPVFEVDDIMAFDPLRVKRLEVVTRNFYVGPIVIPGIVSYQTYAGDLAGFQIDPRSVSINYEGLQLQREYYSPSYETQKARNTRLPDQRHLIFWAPEVDLSNGSKKLEFYTSDIQGNFVVEVNALGADGTAGFGTANFQVKRADF
jgi:hypothetical protein